MPKSIDELNSLSNLTGTEKLIARQGIDDGTITLDDIKIKSNEDNYTSVEVDGLLSSKSDTSHDHDSRYYTKSQIVDVMYPVGCYYTQYPDADSNTDSVEFPVSQRPSTLFGGTWAEQWSDEAIFFRTRGPLSDSGRSNGFQDDQMQQITGDILADGGICQGFSAPSRNGAFTYTTGNSNRAQLESSANNYKLNFNSANSPGARTGAETRSRNRRIKIWKRTA